MAEINNGQNLKMSSEEYKEQFQTEKTWGLKAQGAT